jgi:hypothetical protein
VEHNIRKWNLIELGPGITVGPGIIIGDVPVFFTPVYFITEDENFLVSETDQNFIEET